MASPPSYFDGQPIQSRMMWPRDTSFIMILQGRCKGWPSKAYLTHHRLAIERTGEDLAVPVTEPADPPEVDCVGDITILPLATRFALPALSQLGSIVPLQCTYLGTFRLHENPSSERHFMRVIDVLPVDNQAITVYGRAGHEQALQHRQTDVSYLFFRPTADRVTTAIAEIIKHARELRAIVTTEKSILLRSTSIRPPDNLIEDPSIEAIDLFYNQAAVTLLVETFSGVNAVGTPVAWTSNDILPFEMHVFKLTHRLRCKRTSHRLWADAGLAIFPSELPVSVNAPAFVSELRRWDKAHLQLWETVLRAGTVGHLQEGDVTTILDCFSLSDDVAKVPVVQWNVTYANRPRAVAEQ